MAFPLAARPRKSSSLSGEDIFDFGTQFRFLEGEGVEQDRWIGNGVGAAFQFRQGSAGASGSFEDWRCF